MRVTLIENPGAGHGRDIDPGSLPSMIRAAGHDLTTVKCGDAGWRAALEGETDLVAVAGGDGTVGMIGRSLIGRQTPIAVLPLGTANNIARSLGIADTPLDALIDGWSSGIAASHDAGIACGPWGVRYFLEAFGLGLFAFVMPDADTDDALRTIPLPGARVDYALSMLQERLAHITVTEVSGAIDDEPISADCVMLEIMLMRFVGPNMFLAPRARPADGKFDIVMAGNGDRDELRSRLESWKRGKPHTPTLRTLRGNRIELEWTGYPVHIDDDVWPGPEEGAIATPAAIEITLKRNALRFLLPRGTG